MENLKDTEFGQGANLRAKKVGKIHVPYFVNACRANISISCTSRSRVSMTDLGAQDSSSSSCLTGKILSK